jgi:acyl carrier protein
MTEDEALDLIAVYTVVDRDKLIRDTALDDLDITSLDFLSVIFEVETRFHIAVDETSVPDLRTVGDFVDYLLALVNNE